MQNRHQKIRENKKCPYTISAPFLAWLLFWIPESPFERGNSWLIVESLQKLLLLFLSPDIVSFISGNPHRLLILKRQEVSLFSTDRETSFCKCLSLLLTWNNCLLQHFQLLANLLSCLYRKLLTLSFVCVCHLPGALWDVRGLLVHLF